MTTDTLQTCHENAPTRVQAVHRVGAGHLAAPLWVADILVALYIDVANVAPEQPDKRMCRGTKPGRVQGASGVGPRCAAKRWKT